MLTEPLDPGRAASLRAAVLALKAAERRRQFPPVVQVGQPGGCATRHAVRAGDMLDHSLGADVVAALLLRARPQAEDPVVWLTRPGEPTWHDVDAAWLPAAAAAYAEAGVPLTFVVVTRHGWYDPRSGVARVWRRLRDRRRREPP